MEPPLIIADRFRILHLAREGGMGSVYRAEEISSGRPVAIKIMRSGGHADEARFFREASVLSSLSFPSIVGCFGVGKLSTGEPWLAMEWLDGESLSTRLERGPLSLHDSLLVVKAITGALVVAHERGIVHRDIKPSNVILENKEPNRARLIDFGLVHIRDAHQATWSGALLGTPDYMAPEQIRGASHVDGRADLYALGVLLFECVTGRLPFVSHGDVLGVITQALFEPAPRMRDIDSTLPASLDNLVNSLLEKDPSQRLGPASAVLAALEVLQYNVVTIVASTPVRKAAGLTENELRFVSVVLVDPGASKVLLDDTLSTDGVPVPLVKAIESLVAPFHGRVEKLHDNRVLVVFPGRGAATDQAIMAARTALAIRNHGANGAIAVVTGRATAEIGSMYSDAAVRAAVLAKTAAEHRGTIAIDETTRGLLDQRFVVERERDTHFLLFEDLSKKTGRLLCGRPAPFVGREREVSFIERIFEEVVSEPRASAVIVIGEAGAGKSRLCREVLSTLSLLEPTTEIWIARGQAATPGGSFGMLTTALLRAADIREGEPNEVRYQKLGAFIQARVGPNVAPSIIMFLGEILGSGVVFGAENAELRAARRDPVLMGDRLRLAFEDLVDSVTQNRPLVLVLEDLHWGDVPSVKLLDVSFRKLRTRPFLVLALGRPEMLEAFPGLFAERSPHTIRLSGLSRRACQNLVRRVLGDKATNETIANIVDRSAGHPLFLEELVRSMTDFATPGGNDLPETVLAMVQSRVNKLPAEARRVLRAASVFGETFWRGGVSKLLGAEGKMEGLESWLDVLCDREIVEEMRESHFPLEQEYHFRHALLRESAYAMLTDGDKATGHELAGIYLEERGETNAESLAAHFDRSLEPQRAAQYHLQAARHALLGSDFDAVLKHVDKILAACADDKLLGEAITVKAETMHWRGAYEEAGELAEIALMKLEPGSALWFATLTIRSISAVRCIQLDKLRQVCTTLATWGAANEWTNDFVEAAVRTGLQAFLGGQYKNAQELTAPLDSLLQQSADCEPRTRALLEFFAAIQANIAWKYDQAIEHFLGASRLYDELGDQRSSAGHRVDASFLLVDLGQGEQAIRICSAVLPIAERLSVARHRTTAKMLMGTALFHLGRLDESLEILLETKKELDTSSDVRTGGSIRNKLGRCYRLRGEWELAEKMFDEAEQMLTTLPRLRTICHANRALLFLQMKKPSAALEQGSIAMKLLAELGRMGTDEILVRHAFVESLRHCEHTEEARKELVIAKERLHWMAENLADTVIKRGFLTAIEENRRIFEMETSEIGA